MRSFQLKFIFIILALIFFIKPFEIYSYKKKNQNIIKAEDLIKQKKFNDASKLLSGELVNDPDDEYLIMNLLDKIDKEKNKVVSLMFDIKDSLQKGLYDKADKLFGILEKSGDFDSRINNMISTLLKEKEPIKKIMQFNNYVANDAVKFILKNDVKDALSSYKKALDIYRNEQLGVQDNEFAALVLRFNDVEKELTASNLEGYSDLSDDKLSYDLISSENGKNKPLLGKWKIAEDDLINLSASLDRLNPEIKKEIKFEAYNSITSKYIKLIRVGIQKYGITYSNRLMALIEKEIDDYNTRDKDKFESISRMFVLLNELEKTAFYNIEIDYDSGNNTQRSSSVILSYLNYITKKNSLILKYRQAGAWNDYYAASKYYDEHTLLKSNKELQEAKDVLVKAGGIIPDIYKGSSTIKAKLSLFEGLKNNNFDDFGVKNRELIKNTDELSGKINSGLAEINDMLNYANGLLGEADKSYNDSVGLYNQKYYGNAGENFNKAKDKYIDIRSMIKSDYVEKQINKIDDYLDKIEQVSFKEDINNAEQFLEKAKTSFYDGKYDDAKSNIDEASTLYKKYNQNEDEINYYRDRILSAIKILSGSKLSIDDSAYNQIVELFKNSRINFDREDYDKAYQFITQILLEKPYYEEARLFEIKILQKKDIKSFEQIFENYYQRALDKYNAKKYDDALIEFNELLQFNKNTGEINDYIYKCKVALNLTKPVVSEDQRDRAAMLIKDAQNYYASGDFSKAYGNVNEALRLWEDVPDARGIKLACMQKLKIERPKLTIENDLKFREANKAYSENDFQKAFSLTDEILKNQDYEEVRKLNRKAELKIKNK